MGWINSHGRGCHCETICQYRVLDAAPMVFDLTAQHTMGEAYNKIRGFPSAANTPSRLV